MKIGNEVHARALAIVFFCASGAFGQITGQDREDESDWLKIVPADAGFYVELRDLAGIRRQFGELGIWRTVRELSEKDAAGASTQPWQRRTEELLGLNPEAAISILLGRRTALIAASSAQWQDGVLLADLARAADLRPLLRRWGATRVANEGPVGKYSLSGGITLAVLGRTLVLGPAGDPDGLWGRTVLLLSGQRGPTLAGRSEFAGLWSRLSQDYPCLAYAVWPEGDATAFRGCSRLLVGVSVEPWGITGEIRGFREHAEEDALPVDLSAVGGLPVNSMAVWADSFDFSSLAGDAAAEWSRGQDLLIQLLLGSFATPRGGSSGLLGRLGPGYVVVVGPDRSASSASFTVPAMTAIIEAREAEEDTQRLDMVFGFLAQAVAVMGTPRGEQPQAVPIIRTLCEKVQLHHMEIGPLLAQRTGLEVLEGIRPCWAVLDGRLIVSTSTDHVEEIVRASRGKLPRLGGGSGLGGLLPEKIGEEAVAEWLFIRGSAISHMGSSWLRFLRREHPQTLKRQWWQRWASEHLERRARLGVGLEKDTTHGRRAVVREVERNTPAAGRLRVGDVIVGAAGRALVTRRPAEEVAARYRTRGDAPEFELEILRDGESMTVRIPVLPASSLELGEFDPAAELRQLIILSRRAETVTVWRYATGPDRFDAQIVIRWDRAGDRDRSPRRARRDRG